MDDEARPPAEDRVVLILSGRRGTAVAAALVAGESAPQVPAPGPLTKIPGNRPHVAERGRADALRGQCDGGEAIANEGVTRQLRQSNRAADSYAAVGARGDLTGVGNSREVDEHLWPREVFAD
jgi:hypothetical protein